MQRDRRSLRLKDPSVIHLSKHDAQSLRELRERLESLNAKHGSVFRSETFKASKTTDPKSRQITQR